MTQPTAPARPVRVSPAQANAEQHEALAQLRGCGPDPGWIRERSTTAKDLVAALLCKLKLDERSHLSEILDSWPAIVGDFNARESFPEKISRGTLVVRVSNAPLKYQFESQKRNIVERVNAILGPATIRSVRLSI